MKTAKLDVKISNLVIFCEYSDFCREACGSTRLEFG